MVAILAQFPSEDDELQTSEVVQQLVRMSKLQVCKWLDPGYVGTLDTVVSFLNLIVQGAARDEVRAQLGSTFMHRVAHRSQYFLSGEVSKAGQTEVVVGKQWLLVAQAPREALRCSPRSKLRSVLSKFS